MELTTYQKDVISAKICPYCNGKTKVVKEKFIYGKTYKGKSIICCENFPKCDAFVGTHANGEPLGRLANKDLRKAKIEAHKYFDILWQKHGIDRTDLYSMLSEHLKLPKELTHIGMFQKTTCQKVVQWAKEFSFETIEPDFEDLHPDCGMRD